QHLPAPSEPGGFVPAAADSPVEAGYPFFQHPLREPKPLYGGPQDLIGKHNEDALRQIRARIAAEVEQESPDEGPQVTYKLAAGMRAHARFPINWVTRHNCGEPIVRCETAVQKEELAAHPT